MTPETSSSRAACAASVQPICPSLSPPPHRMTCRRRKLLEIICGAAALAVFFLPVKSRADIVILHLRNGDRITGAVIYDNTNEVTLFNAWSKEIVVPVSQIERRELVTNAPAVTAP